jgi:hypothetical protein
MPTNPTPLVPSSSTKANSSGKLDPLEVLKMMQGQSSSNYSNDIISKDLSPLERLKMQAGLALAKPTPDLSDITKNSSNNIAPFSRKNPSQNSNGFSIPISVDSENISNQPNPNQNSTLPLPNFSSQSFVQPFEPPKPQAEQPTKPIENSFDRFSLDASNSDTNSTATETGLSNSNSKPETPETPTDTRFKPFENRNVIASNSETPSEVKPISTLQIADQQGLPDQTTTVKTPNTVQELLAMIGVSKKESPVQVPLDLFNMTESLRQA